MSWDVVKLKIVYSEDWGWLTTFLPYGEALRKHRALMHRFIGSTDSALDFRDAQVNGVHAMLKAILEHPDDYGKYVNRYAKNQRSVLSSSKPLDFQALSS